MYGDSFFELLPVFVWCWLVATVTLHLRRPLLPFVDARPFPDLSGPYEPFRGERSALRALPGALVITLVCASTAIIPDANHWVRSLIAGAVGGVGGMLVQHATVASLHPSDAISGGACASTDVYDSRNGPYTLGAALRFSETLAMLRAKRANKR